ncbi:MAG: hypothetical protein R3F56_02605 [Planctomycetota bacterium]
MATITRRIGLSLGADICWAAAFEDILRDLDLSIPQGKDTIKLACERLTIEPYDLRDEVGYDLVIDRLTHWFTPRREWIKKAVLLDGVYVWNNPWTVQAMEKHTTYCAMMRLGLPIPKTRILPPKEYEPKTDLRVTLERYARLFDVAAQGQAVGYPLFMKPFDGGGWVGVSKVDDAADLCTAYEASGRAMMHLQQGIVPFDAFVRGLGIGPQFHVMRYDPSQPLHGRYLPDDDFLAPADAAVVRDTTLTINAFFGWDFNSCEMLGQAGTWYPIDFANPCPDSQVTSLHCHWPWLVLAKVRWAVFCAATKRRFVHNQNWQPYFDVAAKDLPQREKLAAYARLAAAHFEATRFEDFCGQHLGQLDALAHDYFGSSRCHDAVRQKVEALYPKIEVEAFTERFWQGVQTWRARQQQDAGAARVAASQANPADKGNSAKGNKR